MRYTSLIFLIVSQFHAFAQDYNTRRYVTENGQKSEFYVYANDQAIRVNDTVFYYWFKSQKVHRSKGGYAGKLLHGTYNKFYFDGQIQEKGSFKKGVKIDKWYTWYENGELESFYNYKKGFKHGRYFLYNSDGSIAERGKFKKNKRKIKKEKSRKESLKLEQNKVSVDSTKVKFRVKDLFKSSKSSKDSTNQVNIKTQFLE